jgi:hypothetical protein
MGADGDYPGDRVDLIASSPCAKSTLKPALAQERNLTGTLSQPCSRTNAKSAPQFDAGEDKRRSWPASLDGGSRKLPVLEAKSAVAPRHSVSRPPTDQAFRHLIYLCRDSKYSLTSVPSPITSPSARKANQGIRMSSRMTLVAMNCHNVPPPMPPSEWATDSP